MGSSEMEKSGKEKEPKSPPPSSSSALVISQVGNVIDLMVAKLFVSVMLWCLMFLCFAGTFFCC